MSDKAFQKRTFAFGIRYVRLVETLPKSEPLRKEANETISITVSSIKTARKNAKK
jgi:hypothetical protein